MTNPESAALEAMLRHRRLILEAIQQGTGLKCFTAEEEQLAEAVKEVRGGWGGWGGMTDIFPENSTRPGMLLFLRETPNSAECLLPAEPTLRGTSLFFYSPNSVWQVMSSTFYR